MEETKLYDMDSTELGELVETSKYKLQEKNKRYKELIDEKRDLLRAYPKLQLILDEDKNFELSETECKMLRKLVALYMQLQSYEEREIFFLGARENYFYFKNLGLIKE